MENLNSPELRRRNHNANSTSVLAKFINFASSEKEFVGGLRCRSRSLSLEQGLPVFVQQWPCAKPATW